MEDCGACSARLSTCRTRWLEGTGMRDTRVFHFVQSRVAVLIRIALLICGALPSLDSCAGTPHQGQPTVQGQAMQYMLADVDQIRAFVYGSSTQVDAEKAAIDLLSWSRRMAELFPPGQASTDYVDMTPERVRGAPVAMSRSAEMLLTTVRAGGRPAIGEQLAQTEREGCGYCHLSGTR